MNFQSTVLQSLLTLKPLPIALRMKIMNEIMCFNLSKYEAGLLHIKIVGFSRYHEIQKRFAIERVRLWLLNAKGTAFIILNSMRK